MSRSYKRDLKTRKQATRRVLLATMRHSTHVDVRCCSSPLASRITPSHARTIHLWSRPRRVSEKRAAQRCIRALPDFSDLQSLATIVQSFVDTLVELSPSELQPSEIAIGGDLVNLASLHWSTASALRLSVSPPPPQIIKLRISARRA